MQKSIHNQQYLEGNTKNLKELLIGRIEQFGHFNFSDDSWYFSKKHKDSLPKASYTITFYQAPSQYKEWVKYYALFSETSIYDTFQKCLRISRFLKYIVQYHSGIPLAEINRDHVNAYEYFLRQDNSSIVNQQKHYAALQDFFMKLTDFDEMPNIVPTKNKNPFPFIKEKSKRKPLSKKVLRSWDLVMKNESNNIPIEFRTVYWLLRSFPNRITEILSMQRDCLKSFYGEYVIQIPTFKQSGGFDREEVKMIPVAYTGHGKYVVDLIRDLQKQTEKLLVEYPTVQGAKTDYLFVIRNWSFKGKNGNLEVKFSSRSSTNITNWQRPKINLLLCQLALIFDFRDESGLLVIPTTHQFRHNTVTDRLYTVGYTTEQVRRLTGHKNEVMTKHYTHQLVEQHKAIHLGISGLRNPNDSPVEFRGKILNLDDRTIKQLSKDSRRYLTWEANGKKGVGICSDISGCNPKGTSVHFECYACDWFVPKLEYYDDYKTEHAYWQEIIDRTAKDPRRSAHFENAVRNLSYLERILSICEKGIAQFKDNKLEAKLNNLTKSPDWV
ncbi:tyrosine-type recombinase/integrase [Bacillus sp. FJAT-29790]|uniref:tyrosine-type recombinase/integrase n=1 Tax=Bacillus sp. FJAT-29790 TaxID=1895002 RepID=UPI001C222CCE|nr:tyrosine-type recombinase/integrase [Bacillus sp. FJAT-29790]MBU8879238.1 tyrosine-type recombinase/integrase [Bacillus sp. FJAT-29790]